MRGADETRRGKIAARKVVARRQRDRIVEARNHGRCRCSRDSSHHYLPPVAIQMGGTLVEPMREPVRSVDQNRTTAGGVRMRPLRRVENIRKHAALARTARG
jgi:hypothetical protein